MEVWSRYRMGWDFRVVAENLRLCPNYAGSTKDASCPEPGRIVPFGMEIEAWYTCIYCLQQNAVLVDTSGGTKQEYVEDCQVCCRPNRLHITIHPDLHEAEIRAGEA